MKATAKIIGAYVRARAATTGVDMAIQAHGMPKGVDVTAHTTDRKNLYKPIRVKPEETQTLQWLTPGNTLTYTIITNLEWQII